MNVLSVCSGAGGMDLGFHRAGHRTIGLCEWDEWRRKLLAARFPGVPIHDDLARLADECEADPAAVIRWLGGVRPRLLIGGTPCQDLSGAGKGAGLDGARSGLYWDYQRVRIALGIEWAVWENVEGALRSNGGMDFAQVLAAFVGADVLVPAAGWASSGVATGPWGGCVWRLLDAQHFGVPQRRKRVFVVGHLGAECPPEVLLESARSGRDHPPGSEARPRSARVAATLTRGASGPGVSAPGRRQEDDVNIVVGTLPARGKTGGHDVDPSMAADGHLVTGTVSAKWRKGTGGPAGDECQNLVAHTLRGTAGFDASEDGTGRGTPLVATHELRGEPARRGPGEPGGGEPVGRRRQAGAGLPGGSDRGDRPEAHADGVRAADGLAGRLDDPNPRPDGRRYAACGDGVVAPVAEWIGRRIPERGSLI